MNYFIVVVALLIEAVLLIVITGVFALWLKGWTSIALPSLGIIVSSGLVLCFLTIIEMIAIIICAYMIRNILPY